MEFPTTVPRNLKEATVSTGSPLMFRGDGFLLLFPEVDDHLCFGDVKCQVIGGAPFCQFADFIPVDRFVTIVYQANHGGVFCKFNYSVYIVGRVQSYV